MYSVRDLLTIGALDVEKDALDEYLVWTYLHSTISALCLKVDVLHDSPRIYELEKK